MVILFPLLFRDLLELGLISEVLTPPTVINPFSVAVNSEGKPKLILDLRHVNSYTELAAKKIFSRHSTVPTLFGLIWSERVR